MFEDVGFQYPGSERWAVRHVNFALRPGERIALVGENGAGKTTLTKLLARLYDPTEGRILLDGVDLRDYDLASLRDAIGVIFQDFVRYDMRFDENVGVGEIEARARAISTPSATRSENDASTPPSGAASTRRSSRWRRRCSRASRAATARCSGAASMTASTSRAASGRRSRWRAPTCATPRC